MSCLLIPIFCANYCILSNDANSVCYASNKTTETGHYPSTWYENLVQTLANLAANTGDADIRELLSSEGISYTVNAPAAAQASPETAPKPGVSIDE